MTLDSILNFTVQFVQAHQHWALPIVFGLAFGESLAFISLLLPATVLLLGLGALIGQSGLPFIPIWLAAIAGAFLGDWVSYWFGFHYRERVAHMWPFTRSPELLPRGHAFFERWGGIGVFIGRFFGPLRAVVPLVAGICAMPQRYFQIANLTSAIIWATGMLVPGMFGLPWLTHWLS
ncbi:MAG: DedA family protein [Enterobacteriaceae bacterium]